jgi:general secretion pathway protein A
MYEQYWQLQQRPFDDTADSRFYYPASDHQAAWLKLRYAIENRRAAAALSGSAGIGKTLLTRCLAQQLPEHIAPVVHVVFPQMPAEQLLATLADRLCGPDDQNDVRHSLRRIEAFLQANSEAGRQALVVIDEAHVLAECGTLETLRLLTNLQAHGQPAMTVILSGLPRLLTSLERCVELEQRIAVRCILPRLSEEESACYVQHRLQTAGAEQTIFDASGLKALHDLSQGVPRRINRLADLALVIGYAGEHTILGAAQIEAVAEELAATA